MRYIPQVYIYIYVCICEIICYLKNVFLIIYQSTYAFACTDAYSNQQYIYIYIVFEVCLETL